MAIAGCVTPACPVHLPKLPIECGAFSAHVQSIPAPLFTAIKPSSYREKPGIHPGSLDRVERLSCVTLQGSANQLPLVVSEKTPQYAFILSCYQLA